MGHDVSHKPVSRLLGDARQGTLSVILLSCFRTNVPLYVKRWLIIGTGSGTFVKNPSIRASQHNPNISIKRLNIKYLNRIHTLVCQLLK